MNFIIKSLVRKLHAAILAEQEVREDLDIHGYDTPEKVMELLEKFIDEEREDVLGRK